MELGDVDRAAVVEAMRVVRERGEREGGARHLRGRVWEIRVDQGECTYRVLFASVGGRGRILLSLEAFVKKTQKTPASKIALAEQRLRDWEERGDHQGG